MDFMFMENYELDNSEYFSTVQKKVDTKWPIGISTYQQCLFQDHIKELEGCQNKESSLKKANKELQLQFKNFMTQSSLLRAENEKLLQE